MAKVFLDMDGVLCEMIAAALVRLKPPTDFSWPLGVVHLHEALGRPYDVVWARLADHRFWANLEPTAEFADFVRVAAEGVGRDNVFILSAPTRSPHSASGKMAWLSEHLPDFVEEDRVVLTRAKYTCARPGDVLVDDSAKNTSAWEAAGGTAVLVPRPWNWAHRLSPATAVDELRDVLKGSTRCPRQTTRTRPV